MSLHYHHLRCIYCGCGNQSPRWKPGRPPRTRFLGMFLFARAGRPSRLTGKCWQCGGVMDFANILEWMTAASTTLDVKEGAPS